ncbi:MAG: ABC transporter substrate-binding protein [Proteobacteria bacterium]|nr:ABC transporter substrate-binding protein [Pseudomonadota bacterium]
MRRRVLLAMLGAAMVRPPIAGAQAPGKKLPRIGYLRHGTAEGDTHRNAFTLGLADFGYVEGQTVMVDYRYTDGRGDLLEPYVKELIAAPVHIIVTSGTPAVAAAVGATRTTPVVAAAIADPVASGLIASLAHPGGNVTGTSILATDLTRKRLELLHEAVPQVTKVALLGSVGNSSIALQAAEFHAAAEIIGITVKSYQVEAADGLAAAFAAMRQDAMGAVVIHPVAELTSYRDTIVRLAMTDRLPTLGGSSAFARAGSLMTYGTGDDSGYRRAGYFIDRILNGTKPGDLPFEQITKIELVVNLKTAKTLGLAVPPSILVRADEVIE